MVWEKEGVSNPLFLPPFILTHEEMRLSGGFLVK
jgi:hypothetical protein